MADLINRVEYLELDDGADGVALNTPAWECTDYSQLYDAAALVGENIHVPGTGGDLWQPHDEGGLLAALPMEFFGDAAPDGTPYSDGAAGLRSNLDLFRVRVLRYLPGQLRTATFHQLDGTTRSCDLMPVPQLGLGFHGPVKAKGTLTVSIPAGVLT